MLQIVFNKITRNHVWSLHGYAAESRAISDKKWFLLYSVHPSTFLAAMAVVFLCSFSVLWWPWMLWWWANLVWARESVVAIITSRSETLQKRLEYSSTLSNIQQLWWRWGTQLLIIFLWMASLQSSVGAITNTYLPTLYWHWVIFLTGPSLKIPKLSAHPQKNKKYFVFPPF